MFNNLYDKFYLFSGLTKLFKKTVLVSVFLISLVFILKVIFYLFYYGALYSYLFE